jgi:hypothetical protein
MRTMKIRYCPVLPTKKLIAARVADELSKENEVEADLIKGRLLELSVRIDDEKVIETNPLCIHYQAGW